MHATEHTLRETNAALEERVRERPTAPEALNEEMRHSGSYFRPLIDGASSHAIYTLDLHGHVSGWNAVAEKIKGYVDEEIIGRHFSCFYTAEDVAEDLPTQALTQTLAEGRYSDEGYRLRKDGSRFWAKVTITPYLDDQGHTVGFVKVTQDITERKLAEEARQEAEGRLENTLRWSHTGGWDLDLRDLKVYRTLEHDQIFGYEEMLPEWTYAIFLAHVVPEDRVRADQLFHEAIAEQKEWDIECRIRRADGAVRWIRVVGGQFIDAHGQAGRMSGIVQDITKRKAVENALRAERDMFASIVATVPMVICSFIRYRGGRWSFPFAGPEIRQIYGFEASELVEDASGVYKRIHPDDRAHFLATLRVSGGTMTPWRAEYRVNHPSRGKIWVEAHAVPRREPDGTILWHGYLADITERKQAENALAERERMLQFVTSTVRAGIVVMGPDYQYLFANEAYGQIYGLDPEQIVGKTIPEVLPHAWSQIKPHLDEALHGAPGQFELTLPPLPGGHGERTFFAVYEPRLREDGTPTSVVVVTDISARKQVESTLVDRERLLGVVTSTIRVGLVVVGSDYRYQFANEAYASIFGLDPEDVVGHCVPELLAVAWPQIQPRLDRALAGERVVYELVLPPQGDQPTRFFTVNYEPHFDEYGTPSVVVVAVDITERKRAEAEALEREERFRQITENIREVFWLNDSNTQRVLYVSPAYETIWGRTCDSLYAAPEEWLESIHPEDRERVRVTSLQQQTTGSYEAEYRIVRPDGSVRWIQDRGFPVDNDVGVVYRIAGVAEDVTDRLRAEAASKIQQMRLEGIVNSAMDGIITVDEDQRIILINHAAEQIFACRAQDVLGERVERFIPQRFRAGHAGHVHSFGETGVAARAMGRFGPISGLRSDGEEFPLEASISQIQVEGQKLFTVTCRDMTERAQAAETQRMLEAQLQQSQKMEAFGQLAGGVAHDFNNLLTIILGYSEWLLTYLPPSSEYLGIIEEINRAGERAAALTRQLLAFSRQQVIEPKVLNPNSVVEGVEKMLRRMIGEDIQLATLLQSHISPVKIDPGQIEQVLMNLAVNARDAMPHGGKLTIETSNIELDELFAKTHAAALPGRYVLLAMSDTGSGMSPEVRDRIFEPFFTTKGIGKGTGLGLAVVHGIVKQSGGILQVYSELGVGTTFKIYLPVVDESPVDLAAVNRSEVPRGTETVLLVEDESAVRELTALALGKIGYTILTAPGGEEALLLMDGHERSIDLLITDVVMPELSGRELAELLLTRHRGLKVLFVSGYTDDVVVRHGVLQADVAFLHKPFTLAALARKVREVLDS